MQRAPPCLNATIVCETTLSDVGGFSSSDVPLTNDGVAAYIDGKWHSTLGTKGAGMAPGQTCDRGTLSAHAPSGDAKK